jgi:hypothetical protein
MADKVSNEAGLLTPGPTLGHRLDGSVLESGSGDSIPLLPVVDHYPRRGGSFRRQAARVEGLADPRGGGSISGREASDTGSPVVAKKNQIALGGGPDGR